MRPKDNLTTPNEKFHTPQKEQVVPAEKRSPIKHDDNLYLSGDFPQREEPKYIPAERPTQGTILIITFFIERKANMISHNRCIFLTVRPKDNLTTPNEKFEAPKPQEYIPADRPTQGIVNQHCRERSTEREREINSH